MAEIHLRREEKLRRFPSAVAAASTLLAGAASAPDITCGLSVDQLFQSRVAVNDGIKAGAADHGFGVVEVVADGDAQQRIARVQSLIPSGVDAVMVCAVDQNTIERALIAADRAGIPVVAHDDDLPDCRVVKALVGSDSLVDGAPRGRVYRECSGRAGTARW